MTLSREKIDELTAYYKEIKADIEKRISDFENIWKTDSNEKLFGELVFCILTPQSKARTCWAAVKDMKEKDILFNGTPDEIRNSIKSVRFYNNKTKYIVKARKKFKKIKRRIQSHKDSLKLRNWIAENVLGLGYKEASHFLRNIGLGGDIAILDRHILKNLKIIGVIDDIPKPITKNKYFFIEDKMREFSTEIGIPISHIDLLMWSKETGEIFK